ncbi:hypothetical protein SmJEL517_g03197 [Synchytrium microbalum]|uniref:Uncharacterized protein n=1 Tax=Synchytrium microbalum TaxID=1806994 RepID=A0A507C7K6_9FUNG|nr:uncharacterized protein SmJEL517_g03197 [Synchytrium microbalum]TPX33976.1 hypothetical protein SmJEL517_g03197 [Synchytrium microbalum]
MENETTPLLRNAPSGDTLVSDVPQTAVNIKTLHQRSVLKRLAVYSCGLLLTALTILVPIVYLVIIPSKIHEFASGGRGLEVHTVELHSLDADQVDCSLTATMWLKAAAPRGFSLYPADFDLALDTAAPEGTTRDVDLRDAGIHLTKFPFNSPLSATEGVEYIPVALRTAFGDLNVRMISGLINDIIHLGKALPPQTVSIQGKPYVKPNTFWTLPGGFQVNIEKYFTVSLADTIGDAKKYNFTIVDKKITPILNGAASDDILLGTDKLGRHVNTVKQKLQTSLIPQQFAIFVNASFDNPHSLTVHAQGFGVKLSVYYLNNRIVDIFVPTTTHLVLGHNDNVTVTGITVKEHFMQLMDLVSKYSDGEAIDLVLKDFSLFYDAGRQPVPWVEDMIAKWVFPVSIPAKIDE